MNRRSTDVWLEEGFAVAAPTRWSRTAEVLKPNPALCVLEPTGPSDSLLKKLRGGVVSMMPKRFSAIIDNYQLNDIRSVNEDDVPSSPIAISITSPSKFDRRRASALSEVMTHEGDADEGEGATTVQTAEIQIATKGRMSVSPVVFCGRPGSAAIVRGEGGYDLDWMTAGVLPK